MRSSRFEKMTINLSLYLLGTFIILTSIFFITNNMNKEKYRELTAKKAVLETLGVSSLTISADCTGTKNSLSDLCGCLSDVPGGYCYHNDCNTVGEHQ